MAKAAAKASEAAAKELAEVTARCAQAVQACQFVGGTQGTDAPHHWACRRRRGHLLAPSDISSPPHGDRRGWARAAAVVPMVVPMAVTMAVVVVMTAVRAALQAGSKVTRRRQL